MSKINPKVREDVYNIKKGDEIRVGGMLYKAAESFDVKRDGVLVSCYNDYTKGGYDEKNKYFLTAEYIFEKCHLAEDMMSISYYVEKFADYRQDKEVLTPPFSVENMDQLYDCFDKRDRRKEFFTKDARKQYLELSEYELKRIADYFGDTVSPFIGELCYCYAAIYGEKTISETAEGQRDKDEVIRVCQTKFPWISSDNVICTLKRVCYYANI